MKDKRWAIHKFGGSSLADAACFRRVADIVAELPGGTLGIVVSAMRGTTDALLGLTALAERGDRGFADALAGIGERHAATARELIAGPRLAELLDAWQADAARIQDLLHTVAGEGEPSPHARDVVAGFGELWSARLLSSYLAERLGEDRAGTWIDARRVVTVRQTELGPAVQWDVTRRRWRENLAEDFDGIVVITGFIASDEQGVQTTLGRNGSDFSASIFAALAGADELYIWTDVDGVMSADPNRVPEAKIIPSLTYSEAMELAYFGAKVIHPQTLVPAVEHGIPVIIRNTFAPDQPGSRVLATATSEEQIKGITAIAGMALVNLEGSGMVGVPGTADRLFGALKKAGVSVTLISQASSEHSICVAVPESLAERARSVVAEAFAEELAGGQIQKVDVTPGQSIIAVVGDGMAGTPGIAGRFFGTLGRAGVNVRAIAQGSSERNISAVIDTSEATRALRAVHSGFYLSAKTISIGLIGPGSVGATLLRQLERQGERLREEFNLDLRIRAIARSSRMLLGDRRIALDGWRQALAESTTPLDLEALERHVDADHLPHAAIVDCTASDDVARRYAGWLARGIHVVTPNKKAFSGDPGYYAELKRSCRAGNSHCFYETTVGAALPVIRTLRDLVDTGDRVHSIQGILSGTLAYLFNVFDGSMPFSEIVLAARESGFTEPDPRDDLSGMDVARKLTILAREMGSTIEIGDFPVENLVPENLREVDLDEFLRRLPEHDEAMAARFDAARKRGRRLRYIARLDEHGAASVGLEEVPPDSAFSHINLTDNIVQFVSERYSANPLVVQGPGAGPEVTAAGVFADLLRLAAFVGDGVSV
ncbi:MAG TPA: bifunctional aspartate kinase/homoserine dehydrogenase I [Woeseiaceae bacterium]|nr:bifunctional aspartate kinase/homoserine dehydrogenase I [Woeseiaceae bacterium]